MHNFDLFKKIEFPSSDSQQSSFPHYQEMAVKGEQEKLVEEKVVIQRKTGGFLFGPKDLNTSFVLISWQFVLRLLDAIRPANILPSGPSLDLDLPFLNRLQDAQTRIETYLAQGLKAIHHPSEKYQSL